mmetsp:Transcript_9887/g.11101  ORF Transcript_9887/g.11101 Transcript_9887/m.11101 type:complete len:300 (-) Transcript_9887:38-937(-)
MEPNNSNVLQCLICGIDTFNYWVSENKRTSMSFTCLRCSLKNVEYLRETSNKVKFYYKYEQRELEIFFKRLEGKMADPGYIDSGKQINLLLKADWPAVRTKQHMVEEKLPCIFYDGTQTEEVFSKFGRRSQEEEKYDYQNSDRDSVRTEPPTEKQPKVNKRRRKMKQKVQEESEHAESNCPSGFGAFVKEMPAPTKAEPKKAAKAKRGRKRGRKPLQKNKHNRAEKMEKMIKKLGIIAITQEQRDSTVRYINFVHSKLDKFDYFKGYEKRIEQQLNLILLNQNLGPEVTEVAKSILDFL